LKAFFLKILGFIASLITMVLTSRKWGESKEKINQADAIIKGRKDDSDIDAEPDVSNPFSRMQ